MINSKIEKYLENKNMNFLFLLLANKEVKRLSQIPVNVKNGFKKKLTEVALEHVVENDIPEYIEEIDLEDLSME